MLDIGERLSSYEPLWETWHKDRYIDSGSFAKVYALREEFYGDVRYTAVKIVPIILTDSPTVQKYGYERAIEERKRQVAQEIKNMHRLGGKPYLVHCLNHAFKDVTDDSGNIIGFDLLIQMELLTPLTKYIKENGCLSDNDVGRLAVQIATALKSMHGINMLHRDIKVQNIYINDAGDFLLGDFGVSKQMPSDSFHSLAGTEPFIAPEVWKVRQTKKNYQKTADIYSYGITLYYLMNGNMLPLVDEGSTQNDIEDAVIERLDGKAFPMPRYGSEKLKLVVMKCCEYLPEDRYQSIDELLAALEKALDPNSSQRTPIQQRSPEHETAPDIIRHDAETVKNIRSADEDLQLRAEGGDSDAQNELGDMYFFGKGRSKSDGMAFYWYEKAALAGNVTAQNNLGVCYAYGRGAPKDASEAFYWYSQAAQQGNANGQFNLALCYEAGKGTPKDLRMAAYYYSLAAQQGSAKAQYYLGLCYELGKGVEADPEYAKQLYVLAANGGNKRARQKLDGQI